MRPLVFTVPAYTVPFAIAFACWVIPDRIGSFWWRSSRDAAARRQDRGSFLVLLGAIVAGCGAGFGFAAGWPGGAIPAFRPEVTIAGIVLMLLGVGLRWWAIVTLGRYFTLDVAVRSTQPVVQAGPYRLIRHPSYSGVLLILLGIGLALANWGSLVALPAGGLIGLLYRVRVEERALTEAIGQPYLDYMRRTKRFIPLIV